MPGIPCRPDQSCGEVGWLSSCLGHGVQQRRGGYVTHPMRHGQLKIFAGNEIEHMVAPVTGAVRYSLAVFLHTDTPAPTIPRK